jgi:glycogen operon protein
VNRLRDRIQRNLLATLAFSQGIPMLSHGDELGRTQLGNNNAYCHDGPLTWLDWSLDPSQQELLDFTRAVFSIRAANPVLRRRTFSPDAAALQPMADLTWVGPDGRAMRAEEWEDPASHVVGMLIRGEASDETDQRGRALGGDPLLLLLNGGGRSKSFILPPLGWPGTWSYLIDTGHPAQQAALDTIGLGPHSLVLLRYQANPPPAHR